MLTALAFPAVSDRGFDFFKRPENLLALALPFFLCLSFTFYPLRFIVDFFADSLRAHLHLPHHTAAHRRSEREQKHQDTKDGTQHPTDKRRFVLIIPAVLLLLLRVDQTG